MELADAVAEWKAGAAVGLDDLAGFLVDAAKGVVRTTLDETPQNSGSPVPVGTQMSRVEEGLVVFSAIHGRAHDGEPQSLPTRLTPSRTKSVS